MVTYKGMLSFLVGFLIAGLCVLFITGASWGACSGVYMINGKGYYQGSVNHPVPKSIVGGASGCYDLSEATYLKVYGTSFGVCNSSDISGWHNCNELDNRGELWVCFASTCDTLPYTCGEIIYEGVLPQNNPPSSYDYDCDGIPDITDGAPGIPGNDPNQKFRRKLSYTNRTSGVTYTLYEGNQGTMFWSSSDGSSKPDDFPADTYRVSVDMYYGSGGYVNYSDLGLGGTQGDSLTSGGVGGKASGADTPGSSSTGNSSGGASGSASTQGSTTDWSTMYDYLAGIQKNTKDTANNLQEVEKDLEKIKQTQAVGSGTGLGTGQQTGTDMSGTISAINQVKTSTDAVKTSVDNLKTSVDTMKSDLENIGDPNSIPEGDTSSMNNNDDLSEEEGQTKFETESSSLSQFMDTYIFQQNPIVNIVTGSGVDDSGGSSSVGVSAGGYSFSLDFSGCEGQLDMIGLFFAGFCGLAGLVDFLRG